MFKINSECEINLSNFQNLIKKLTTPIALSIIIFFFSSVILSGSGIPFFSVANAQRLSPCVLTPSLCNKVSPSGPCILTPALCNVISTTAPCALVDSPKCNPPVAVAGPDQQTEVNQHGGGFPNPTVTLDGTQSYDPTGRPLTYKWTLNSLEYSVGNKVYTYCNSNCDSPLTGADTATPSFVIGNPGPSHFFSYTFQLVVNNGRTDSTNYARTIVDVAGIFPSGAPAKPPPHCLDTETEKGGGCGRGLG